MESVRSLTKEPEVREWSQKQVDSQKSVDRVRSQCIESEVSG